MPSALNDQLSSQLQDRASTLDARQGDILQRSEVVGDSREASLGPLEDQMTTALSQPRPQRRASRPLPLPPEHLPVSSQDYQALSVALIGMALIGGKSKANWMDVSDALNGTVQGFLKGRQGEIEEQYRQYETKFKAAVTDEQMANREFEDLLKDRSLSINELISRYKVVAQKYDRQDARLAAEQKSIDGMWKSLESHQVSLDRITEQRERADKARTERRSAAQQDRISRWRALYPNAALGMPDPKKGDMTFSEFEAAQADPRAKKEIDDALDAIQQGKDPKKVHQLLRDTLKQMGVDISGATEDPVQPDTPLGPGLASGAADVMKRYPAWQREFEEGDTDLQFPDWLKSKGISNPVLPSKTKYPTG